jgi:hypothetical protein
VLVLWVVVIVVVLAVPQKRGRAASNHHQRAGHQQHDGHGTGQVEISNAAAAAATIFLQLSV